MTLCWRRIGMFLSLPLFVSGCVDGGTGTGLIDPEGSSSVEAPSHGAYGLMVVGPFQNGFQALTLRIGSQEFPLSSYQGSLRFNGEKMALLDVTLPEGDFHLINDLEADAGRLQFAGFAVDGFQGVVELRLLFETQGQLLSDDLDLDLQVLGTSVGEEINSNQVLENQLLIKEPVR